MVLNDTVYFVTECTVTVQAYGDADAFAGGYLTAKATLGVTNKALSYDYTNVNFFVYAVVGADCTLISYGYYPDEEQVKLGNGFDEASDGADLSAKLTTALSMAESFEGMLFGASVGGMGNWTGTEVETFFAEQGLDMVTSEDDLLPADFAGFDGNSTFAFFINSSNSDANKQKFVENGKGPRPIAYTFEASGNDCPCFTVFTDL